MKDEHLFELAQEFNTARFFSVGPNEKIRFAAISLGETGAPASLDEALRRLLAVAGAVNVRTFTENPDARSLPFDYGLDTVPTARSIVKAHLARGLHVIVNETVDVNDHGVSGIVDGPVTEFAPDSTPRDVERKAFASLPTAMAERILDTVYQFDTQLTKFDGRVEFSLHPQPVGLRQTGILVWELGPHELDATASAAMVWPNLFSRLLGDKTFGLLVADACGEPVPQTTAMPRRIAPFSFGRATGLHQRWLRTAPVVQEPGRFLTTPIWEDAFAVMQREDPNGKRIAAVLSQAAVDAQYGGAAALAADGGVTIEGVPGTGLDFMSGAAPAPLPPSVVAVVRSALDRLRAELGHPVSIEWLVDERTLWIVQLHVDPVPPAQAEPRAWVELDTSLGLEHVRTAVRRLAREGQGAVLTHQVGLTSHIGQVLRASGVPYRVATG